MRVKSGEFRWFSARGSAVWNKEGQAVRMAGSLRDITDRKFMEQSLVQSEKHSAVGHLAACMRLTALGQLSAGVAHELNNPLSVILGFSQSLAQQFGDNASLKEPLKNIEREALRCKRLVQDLLNFSRLPRSGMVMEDLVQVAEGALSLVETQTRIQNVELLRDFSPDLPKVFLDRHKIQQLLINLCTNALDAMPKGGRLTIQMKCLSDPKEPSLVQISVSDTGTGISPQIREHIFKPFFTTKESGKGTGLGLSLVREVVKEHVGQLDLVSELGKGTTFTVRLPVGHRSASLC